MSGEFGATFVQCITYASIIFMSLVSWSMSIIVSPFPGFNHFPTGHGNGMAKTHKNMTKTKRNKIEKGLNESRVEI